MAWSRENKVSSYKGFVLVVFIININEKLTGEEQMDLMNAAGHHITDVLTELAYFSYLSRREPIHALTHYVRANYVPAQ